MQLKSEAMAEMNAFIAENSIKAEDDIDLLADEPEDDAMDDIQRMTASDNRKGTKRKNIEKWRCAKRCLLARSAYGLAVRIGLLHKSTTMYRRWGRRLSLSSAHFSYTLEAVSAHWITYQTQWSLMRSCVDSCYRPDWYVQVENVLCVQIIQNILTIGFSCSVSFCRSFFSPDVLPRILSGSLRWMPLSWM